MKFGLFLFGRGEPQPNKLTKNNLFSKNRQWSQGEKQIDDFQSKSCFSTVSKGVDKKSQESQEKMVFANGTGDYPIAMTCLSKFQFLLQKKWVSVFLPTSLFSANIKIYYNNEAP